MSDTMKAIMDGGGLVFPATMPLPEGGNFISGGLTFRDHTAIQLMAAMATSAGFQGAPWDNLAADAYEGADALLRARQEQSK